MRRLLTPRRIAPYLFIFPIMLLIVIFRVIPIGYSFWLSTVRYDIVFPENSIFVGLANFERLFRDEFLWASVRNTIVYTLGTMIPGLVLSFIFALIICESWFKFQGLTRALLFVPFVISIVISGLIWSYILNVDFGLLNEIFARLGLPQQRLLGTPRHAIWAPIIMVIWRDLGFRITIWSAGILSISRDYLEAARIDGANWFQEIIFVRLPLLRPVMAFLTVLGIIGSFQAFDAIFVLTGGGPARATEVLVFYLWRTAFRDNNIGYASAMAWLLFVMLVVFTIFQMKAYDKKEGY